METSAIHTFGSTTIRRRYILAGPPTHIPPSTLALPRGLHTTFFILPHRFQSISIRNVKIKSLGSSLICYRDLLFKIFRRRRTQYLSSSTQREFMSYYWFERAAFNTQNTLPY